MWLSWADGGRICPRPANDGAKGELGAHGCAGARRCAACARLAREGGRSGFFCSLCGRKSGVGARSGESSFVLKRISESARKSGRSSLTTRVQRGQRGPPESARILRRAAWIARRGGGHRRNSCALRRPPRWHFFELKRVAAITLCALAEEPRSTGLGSPRTSCQRSAGPRHCRVAPRNPCAFPAASPRRARRSFELQ